MRSLFSRRRRVALVPLLLLLSALGIAAANWASPTPGHASAAPFFSGARISDFPVTYSGLGAISEVLDPAGSGEVVLGLDVSNRDVYPATPTDNPRAELLSPDFIRPGMDVWLTTKFLVPTDYPAVRAGGWVSLVSLYGPPFDGSSPWHLELAGNSLQWQRNATYGFDIPFKAPLARGRWTSVLVHERFASKGFVEMWIDGRPIKFFSDRGYNPRHQAATRRLLMATMDPSNDRGPNSARIMQYRKAGMFGQGTLYFGALEVGRTRASVSPRPAPQAPAPRAAASTKR
jgi:Polysaccharide lyase